MNDTLKKIVTGVVVIALVVVIGYLAYKLYLYAVEDATNKIRTGVSQGVSKGMGGALNPVSWFVPAR